MKLSLTTLGENTASKSGCVAEWGWSIFIQVDELKILFDTGAGFAVCRNADTEGIDFKSIDKIVISHAHADHTGGLRDVLNRAERPEVIAHPSIWDSKYRIKSSPDEAVYNGIPFARPELEKLSNFRLSKDPVRITDNILTTGEIPRITDYEIIESHFYIKEQEEFRRDDFPDDRALIFKTDKGLVIVLGCAHRGIINTIRHAQDITGEKTVHTVIGGTHLYPKPKEQVEKTIQALKEIDVQHIGVSHCTGFKAAMQLADAFGDRFFLNNAGVVHTIE
jgi:7,8-dihydropterin-6-yl-methyl-4-(beta-D-ribofuranosyl)aminobenzene 5'-phosphate synthase